MLFNNGRSAVQFLAAMFATIGLFGAAPAIAQQAKVIKVQGKKAIVQFPDDSRPRVGQIIELAPSGAVSMSGTAGSGGGTGSRAMIVGGSAELSSLTPSGGSTSTTTFAVDGRYGWNMGVMEYGALGTISYASTTGSSRRLLSAGGFFDYNLVPNTPGTEIVYGGMAVGKFGSAATSSGSAEVSGTVMTLEVGGQLKWFPLGNSVAIRGDVLYRIESVSDTIKASSSGSGLVARGGLYVYF
ncbi:hypothetical protein BH10BDE1_BH10BDE1_32920 [soil metagenome]